MTKRTGFAARSKSISAAMTAHRGEAEPEVPNVAPTNDQMAPKARTVGLTLRLDQDRHGALMDVAHALSKQRGRRVSVHSLLVEAVDLVLERHGAGE